MNEILHEQGLARALMLVESTVEELERFASQYGFSFTQFEPTDFIDDFEDWRMV